MDISIAPSELDLLTPVGTLEFMQKYGKILVVEHAIDYLTRMASSKELIAVIHPDPKLNGKFQANFILNDLDSLILFSDPTAAIDAKPLENWKAELPHDIAHILTVLVPKDTWQSFANWAKNLDFNTYQKLYNWHLRRGGIMTVQSAQPVVMEFA